MRFNKPSTPATCPISGLDYAALQPAAYASLASVSRRAARLASDWWLAFVGLGLSPAGFPMKVSEFFFLLLHQAFLAHAKGEL